MRFITLFLTSTLSFSSMAAVDEKALNLSWLNPDISPTNNFYAYANGAWQAQHPIPPEYPNWSVFLELQEKTQDNIRKILEHAAESKSVKAGSIEQKVGDFYFSGMDEATINRQGITPLMPELSKIQAIHNRHDFQTEIARLHRMGIDVLYQFGSMQDFTDSNQMIAAIVQGGLSLPDRDYYLKQDEKFKKVREAFYQHAYRVFLLLNADKQKAREDATTILNIETALARKSLSQVAQRDPHAVYHLMSRDALKKITPNLSWDDYFTDMGLPKLQQINIAMPEFMHALNDELHNHPLNEWKTYLQFHLIETFSPYLSQPFVDEQFRMTQVLLGTEKLLPRWMRVVKTENSALGFAIGKLYVQQYFSPKAKQEVLEIVDNIKKMLRHDLEHLSWMTPQTRQAALKKLALMEERIGYPERWWDYSSLIIDRNSYVLNVLRANQFLVQRDLDKIGKPVDRLEWEMTPQTINAYYNPSMNNINFPTAILQPPFFDESAPDAVNYGGIGFIIGHEITHGFDDQGAKFDEQGNLHNWWQEQDERQFKQATQCIVKQFSNYRVAGNLAVKGQLVVGEATADLGGLTLAYRAFQASDAYKNAPTIAGFTPDQQFFLNAAHAWASNMRPELARHFITTDPHPPAIFRVNGTLANMPSFQSVFHIPDDSPMVNPQRCTIW